MRLRETTHPASAGYFRIGDVVLTIPPERIRVGRASAAEELTALTNRFPFLRRTGRARVDVAISWRAMVTWGADGPDYSEWEKLRRIQAMVAAAPFVEVENAHLRQLMADEVGLEGPAPMAFALRTLRVQTSPDAIDCLEAELEMSWFAYQPFSRRFSYGAPSAAQSESFRRYLDVWIEQNLENARSRAEYPQLAHWRDLAPGVIQFRWREYVFRPDNTPPPAPAGATAAMPAASGRVRPGSVSASDRRAIQQAIIETAARYGVDPALALAVAEKESGFRADADAGRGGGKGVFQLVVSTARDLGIAESDLKDPAVNIDGGVRYLKWMLDRYQGSEADALAAYFAGPGNWDRFRSADPETRMPAGGRPLTVADARRYADDVLRRREKYRGGIPAAPAPEPAGGTAPGGLSDSQIAAFVTAGFLPDYQTEQGTFFYRERLLHACSPEYPCGRGHSSGNPARLYPFSVSIIWSNRLAPLPSPALDLPTFQYCGPMSTLVLIGMHSHGEPDETGEPVHAGARELAAALRLLERQYIELKPFWKKPSSLHRMQALLVECQPLAFFGIYGIMPRTMSSSTLPDSSEMIEISLESVQWENSYERVEARAVKDYPGEATAALAALFEPDNSPLFRRPEFSDLYNIFSRKVDEALASGAMDEFLERSGLPASLTLGEQAEIRARFGLSPGDPIRPRHVVSVLRRSRGGAEEGALAGLRRKLQRRIFEQQEQWQALGLFSSLAAEAASNPQLAHKLRLLMTDPYLLGRSPMGFYNSPFRNCYSHLGLPAGLRIHPAGYFDDERDRTMQQLREQARALSERIARSLEQLNAEVLYGVPVRSSGKQEGPGRPDVKTSYQDSIGPLESILSQAVHPAARSMRMAFPVCQVYLVNEEARIPIFRFHDFYAVNTVLGFEIIRYRDKPDMLLLRLANSLNLLRFRLFDASVQGRFERSNARTVPLRLSKDGEPLTAPASQGAAVTIETDVRGVDRVVLDDLSRQVRVPLQMYPLQTGTKIEVRAGYEEDPDRLPVVFSGLVTAIEEGEILEITAHGFAIELAVPAPDEISGNHFGIGYPVEAIRRVAAAAGNLLNADIQDAVGLLVSSLDRQPAYGGFNFTGPSGDAVGVIGEMLRVSTARHFGDWMALVPAGEVAPLKGWAQARLKDMAGSSQSNLLRMLASGYTRRTENIVVAGRTLPSGERLKMGGQHGHAYYLMSSEGGLYLPAAYSVERPDETTPWRIILDISRRYPTHLLLVRHYGYPRRTEATLVFAHPADFYYARLPYPSEWEELEEAAALGRADAAFRAWWNSSGRTQLEGALLATPELPAWARSAMESEFREDAAEIERGGMRVFLRKMDEYASIASRRALMTSVPVVSGVARLLGSGLQLLTGGTVPGVQAVNPSFWRNLQMNLARIRDDAAAYVRRALRAQGGQSDASELSSRTRPVRKYFFLTSLDILHNGITLNENIFNAVRVTDSERVCANSGIESCLYPVRVLDCRRLVLDYRMNIASQNLGGRVAQSFLREELGKMYQGELLLRGMPEIEPGDVIFLDDAVNDMSGPLVVDSVIHQFDAEAGFVTIVRPRAYVAVNDASCLGLLHALPILCRYLYRYGSFELSQILAGVSDRGTRMEGRQAAARSGARPEEEKWTMAAAAGLAGGTAAAVGAAAAPSPLVGGLFMGGAGASAGLGVAVAGTAAVLLAVPVFLMASFFNSRNPVFLVPLSRSDYPWVAGIDGWEMQSIARHFWTRWDRFYTMELAPYFESIQVLGRLASELPPSP